MQAVSCRGALNLAQIKYFTNLKILNQWLNKYGFLFNQ